MSDVAPRTANRVTRRELIKFAAISAVGLATGAGGAAAITRWQAITPARKFLYLTDEEGSLLTAFCERIIPADDMPGATDAGVVYYIDRQLSGALARHRRMYQMGLVALRDTSRRIYKQEFTALSADLQNDLLRLIERGKAPTELWREINQQDFFRTACTHTMQGFYGSPRHGGNRQYMSFRMLGIPYPQIIGQNR